MEFFCLGDEYGRAAFIMGEVIVIVIISVENEDFAQNGKNYSKRCIMLEGKR